MGVPDPQARRVAARPSGVECRRSSSSNRAVGTARTLPAPHAGRASLPVDATRHRDPRRLRSAIPTSSSPPGIAIGDPFTYVEIDGKRVIVTSELEADVARRTSTRHRGVDRVRVRRPRAGQGRDGLPRRRASRSSAARSRSPASPRRRCRLVPGRAGRLPARARRRRHAPTAQGVRDAPPGEGRARAGGHPHRAAATEAAFARGASRCSAPSSPGADGLRASTASTLTAERVTDAIERRAARARVRGRAAAGRRTARSGANVHEHGQRPDPAGRVR